jgi:hypothetical protein
LSAISTIPQPNQRKRKRRKNEGELDQPSLLLFGAGFEPAAIVDQICGDWANGALLPRAKWRQTVVGGVQAVSFLSPIIITASSRKIQHGKS